MSISLEILFELTSDHVSSVTALPPWPMLSDKLLMSRVQLFVL